MKTIKLLFILLFATFVLAQAQSFEKITTTSSGEVLTNITASATRYSYFDGTVDNIDDLHILLRTAWGYEGLGLHRGHAQIQNVLEAFLGISHDEMHVLMEQKALNLDATCRYLGLDSKNLIESLVNSFRPFVQQALDKGVLNETQAQEWIEKFRIQFTNRVYWDGS